MIAAQMERLADLRERRGAEAAEHRMVTSSLGSLRYCEACGHGGCEDITGGALTAAELAELAQLERREAARLSARKRRSVRYAIKFAIETDSEPTDSEIARILDRCVRAPRPEEYPAIAAAVSDYRAGLIPGTRPARIGAPFTYDQAVELAAKLCQAGMLTEIALAGMHGMRRMTAAERGPAFSMLAELKAEQRALQAITRRGRAAVPNPYVTCQR